MKYIRYCSNVERNLTEMYAKELNMPAVFKRIIAQSTGSKTMSMFWYGIHRLYARGLIYKHWLTLVSIRINYHMSNKMWVEIIYSFPNFPGWCTIEFWHYGDVIVSTKASQITSLTIVYSTVYSSADQRKHQSSASLAFVRGIHRGPVNSPHKEPVTRKMFPFDDVIMGRDK